MSSDGSALRAQNQDARIVFNLERQVTLAPLWFDAQWFDELLADGLSRDEALREMVKMAVEEDPSSVLWEAFGPGEELASEFVASITAIGLGALPVAPVGAQEAPSGRKNAQDELVQAAQRVAEAFDPADGSLFPSEHSSLVSLRAALAALTQSGVDEPRPGADTVARHSPRGGGA